MQTETLPALRAERLTPVYVSLPVRKLRGLEKMFTDRSTKAQRVLIPTLIAIAAMGVLLRIYPPESGFSIRYWPAIAYLLVIGVRYILLLVWEDKHAVDENADERTASVAQRAAQYGFWAMMTITFSSAVVSTSQKEARLTGLLFLIGLATYTFVELRLRREVSKHIKE